jgi:hypothetical protein
MSYTPQQCQEYPWLVIHRDVVTHEDHVAFRITKPTGWAHSKLCLLPNGKHPEFMSFVICGTCHRPIANTTNDITMIHHDEGEK